FAWALSYYLGPPARRGGYPGLAFLCDAARHERDERTGKARRPTTSGDRWRTRRAAGPVGDGGRPRPNGGARGCDAARAWPVRRRAHGIPRRGPVAARVRRGRVLARLGQLLARAPRAAARRVRAGVCRVQLDAC